jgi:hypothetical protein
MLAAHSRWRARVIPRVEIELESRAPPERVIAGLTDFTERRPELWPGLNARMYRVYEVGDMWADVREGNNDKIWARERYDWSTPGTVGWTVQASSFSATGDFVEAVISERAGGGSRIHVTWSRHGKTLVAKAMVALIVLSRGFPVKQSVMAGLRRIEAAG